MRTLMVPLVGALAVAGVALGQDHVDPEPHDAEAEAPTPSVPRDEGLRAFDQMMEVLTHQRCVNCHPAGDRPRQGDDRHLHRFEVRRGADGRGLPALRCGTCHQRENNLFSGVPGAPSWSLAPIEMAWEGKSRVEIARSILDPAINGQRTLEDTVHHLTEHELVLWAWDPGVDASGVPREPPPVPKDAYITAVKTWAAAGAPIPER